jgi:hypothetical protein
VAEERRTLRTARYPTIDILRGLALISMISTHMDNFTRSSMTARVLHSARWVDGAFVFVALSGFVTGLVHHRVVQRSGMRASRNKLVRRAAWLYLVHIGLTLASLAAYNAHPQTFVIDTPTWSQAGGVPMTLWKVLGLRLEPNFNSVLPMYVVLLLWSILVVALLRRGAWWMAIGVSLAVYVVGQTVDGLALTQDTFSIAGWQLLFTGGLLVGWAWEHRLAVLGVRWRGLIVSFASVVVVGMYLLARLLPGAMNREFGSALTKSNGGWLAFVFAGALLVTGYAGFQRARRVPSVNRALRPLEILGAKGLPGYVAMVLAVLVIDFLPDLPRGDAMLVAIATICGLTEYGAIHLRRQPSPHLIAATVDASSPIPAAIQTMPSTDLAAVRH